MRLLVLHYPSNYTVGHYPVLCHLNQQMKVNWRQSRVLRSPTDVSSDALVLHLSLDCNPSESQLICAGCFGVIDVHIHRDLESQS